MDSFDDYWKPELFKVGSNQQLHLTHEGVAFYSRLFKAHGLDIEKIHTLPDLLEALIDVIESQGEYLTELPDAYALTNRITGKIDAEEERIRFVDEMFTGTLSPLQIAYTIEQELTEAQIETKLQRLMGDLKTKRP